MEINNIVKVDDGLFIAHVSVAGFKQATTISFDKLGMNIDGCYVSWDDIHLAREWVDDNLEQGD